MKVYRSEVVIVATAYVRATSKDEAKRKFEGLDCKSPSVLCSDLDRAPSEFDHAGGVPISGRPHNDSKLPSLSLSPAMTIAGLLGEIDEV
jgi:hypothetical protein